MKVFEPGSDRIRVNFRRMHLADRCKMSGERDGLKGRNLESGDPRQIEKSRPRVLKCGLVASRMERKGRIETLHEGKSAGLGHGLKVNKAPKMPLVSHPGAGRPAWSAQFCGEYV